LKEQETILQLENVFKSFFGVPVLKNINLDVKQGEILALVGENGAGKSTIIKVINGIYRPDSGKVYFKGKELTSISPLLAKNLGIATIYQELNLTPNQKVYENIFLGKEPKVIGRSNILGIADKKRMKSEAVKAISTINPYININSFVRDLSIAQRQEVEIARALSSNAKLIIMDEPTSSLSKQETQALIDNIKALRSVGVSILFVSHRLEEVFEVANRICVLRDGQIVGMLNINKTSIEEVIRLMVGRTIHDFFPKEKIEIGEPILDVCQLSKKGKIKDINFTLHKGEILGFAGLVGAGRTDVMQLIFGIEKKDSGRILVEGKQVEILSPSNAINAGIGFVPEDRKLQGLILNMAIRDNISIPNIRSLSKFSIINRRKQQELVSTFVNRLKIKPSHDLLLPVKHLSGGNQQKVVLAKWLSLQPKILILDEPTRGVDIGVKNEIYLLIGEFAKRGVGIILISSELPEILSLSDRIVVMARGNITAILNRNEANQELIMTYATNITRSEFVEKKGFGESVKL